MSSFDEREKACETKFAHDEELDFKVHARTASGAALWAAEKLGKSYADAQEYADAFIEQRLGADISALCDKITADLAAANIDVSRNEVMQEITLLETAASAHFFGDKK